MAHKGQPKDLKPLRNTESNTNLDAFVLDKSIFSNIFEKDIRRVYIYKKSERLAKAIHLVAPAFRESPALRNRIHEIAIGLIDAAVLPPLSARESLSRELLALSSVLSIARASTLLSSMNADLIASEAQLLLHEIAAYEEPRLFLEDAPTLAALFKSAHTNQPDMSTRAPESGVTSHEPRTSRVVSKGQIKDTSMPAKKTGRSEAIISVLTSKGPSYIKDISTVIRDVSEKTIQRELSTLVAEGRVEKKGERRWTTYTLVS
ncbi:MAG: hypothetical protein AAB472_03920 [Patescibacteria group bacterium]